MPPATHPLTLTGERTLPGIAHERYWFARHLVAYRYAVACWPGAWSGAVGAAWRRAATVLDAGCGEGYGADLLRDLARGRACVALDYDAAAIAHVGRAYPGVRAGPRQPGRAARCAPASCDGGGQPADRRARVGPAGVPGRVRARPAPRRACSRCPRRTGSPFRDRRAATRSTRASWTPPSCARWSRPLATGPAILGVHHGPRVRGVRAGVRRPGRGSARRTGRPLGRRARRVRRRRPPGRLRRRRGRCRAPPRRARWTCSRPPCAHDPTAHERGGGRHLLRRPAHAPALARAPRQLAGRRGVAVPGVGRGVPARRRGAGAAGGSAAGATCSRSR